MNLDSSEKSNQDQLSGTVQLRVLVHHHGRRSRFSRLVSVFIQQHGYRLPDHGDSSFGNWVSQVCYKLLYDLGQWAKSRELYKPSEIALITGCGRPLAGNLCHLPLSLYLSLIRRMLEIEQSNLLQYTRQGWGQFRFCNSNSNSNSRAYNSNSNSDSRLSIPISIPIIPVTRWNQYTASIHIHIIIVKLIVQYGKNTNNIMDKTHREY